MVNIEIWIEGVTPLLQHRFSDRSELEVREQARRVAREDVTPRDHAERACYRELDGSLYLPGAAIGRLLREAGAGHKQKGSRRSLKSVVPAGTRVLEDAIRSSRGIELLD